VRDFYLLDTNILVHLIRQDALGQYLNTTFHLLVREPRPIIAVVTEGEIRSLAYQWNWGKLKKERVNFLCGFFGRYSIDSPEVLEVYAVIDSYSESMGRPMGKNDVWIAAVAYVTGAKLLTTDHDFEHLYPKLINYKWIDTNSKL
jgi:tRNA(fMet)-specific endonuclease VapC